MVKIAKEDTYAMEPVGGGVEVRRIVKAGQLVPDHYQIEGDFDEAEARPLTGYGGHVIAQPGESGAPADTDDEADESEKAAPKRGHRQTE